MLRSTLFRLMESPVRVASRVIARSGKGRLRMLAHGMIDRHTLRIKRLSGTRTVRYYVTSPERLPPFHVPGFSRRWRARAASPCASTFNQASRSRTRALMIGNGISCCSWNDGKSCPSLQATSNTM